jgi:hypothetical protein
MEDNKLVLAIRRRLAGCRVWSRSVLGRRPNDDLDNWLVDYRGRLAAGGRVAYAIRRHLLATWSQNCRMDPPRPAAVTGKCREAVWRTRADSFESERKTMACT